MTKANESIRSNDEKASDLACEMARLKEESNAMMRLLSKLEQERYGLELQNEILAREALMCGFDPEVIEPPMPKRRQKAGEKKVESCTT
jgi:hypothetical protein